MMRILLFISCCLFTIYLNGQHCLFDKKNSDNFNLLDEEWLHDSPALSQRSIVTIPVVFHIVWNEKHQDISDLQIHSQLEALNKDFRATNTEIENLYNLTGIEGADAEIEFCLATQLEGEKKEVGIIRKNTSIKEIGLSNNIFYSEQEGSDAWDTQKYLNIWICNLPKNVLGYSSSPIDYGSLNDGIVINYRYFGTIGTATKPYHLGRTLTHEIGHYLGLYHTWGTEQGDCTKDDGIEDTPPQEVVYYGCPNIPQFSCGSEDYFFNFMNFVDDECLSMFTSKQKEKMHYYLEHVRTKLSIENTCSDIDIYTKYETPTIFPNPTNGNINIVWDKQHQSNVNLYCYNILGVLLFEQKMDTASFISFYLETKENLVIFIFRDDRGNSIHKEKLIIL